MPKPCRHAHREPGCAICDLDSSRGDYRLYWSGASLNDVFAASLAISKIDGRPPLFSGGGSRAVASESVVKPKNIGPCIHLGMVIPNKVSGSCRTTHECDRGHGNVRPCVECKTCEDFRGEDDEDGPETPTPPRPTPVAIAESPVVSQHMPTKERNKLLTARSAVAPLGIVGSSGSPGAVYVMDANNTPLEVGVRYMVHQALNEGSPVTFDGSVGEGHVWHTAICCGDEPGPPPPVYVPSGGCPACATVPQNLRITVTQGGGIPVVCVATGIPYEFDTDDYGSGTGWGVAFNVDNCFLFNPVDPAAPSLCGFIVCAGACDPDSVSSTVCNCFSFVGRAKCAGTSIETIYVCSPSVASGQITTFDGECFPFRVTILLSNSLLLEIEAVRV